MNMRKPLFGKRQKKEKGFTLILSLILLGMMSLMSTTSINMNSVELQIAYNAKINQALTDSATQAIEQVISSISAFTSPEDNTVVVNGYSVAVSAPECLGTTPVSGYSAKTGLSPENTHWIISAQVSDVNSGAQVNIQQGLKIRMLSNSCS